MTTLFQLVNSRYDGMRPTIFTSQYSIPQLQNRMSRAGERETAEAICLRIEELSDVVSLLNIDSRRGALFLRLPASILNRCRPSIQKTNQG